MLTDMRKVDFYGFLVIVAKSIAWSIAIFTIIMIAISCSTTKDKTSEQYSKSTINVNEHLLDSLFSRSSGWISYNVNDLVMFGSVTTITLYDNKDIIAVYERKDSIISSSIKTSASYTDDEKTNVAKDDISVSTVDSVVVKTEEHKTMTDRVSSDARSITWLIIVIGVFAASVIIYKNYKRWITK